MRSCRKHWSPGTQKTYNNAISALRRAFNFGYLDYLERVFMVTPS